MTGFQRALISLYRAAAKTSFMRSPAGLRAFEFAYLAYKAMFEARSANRLKPYVEPGTTVIDVGANIGFFTTKFASWVGGQGRVLAIEPETNNLRVLKRRLTRLRLEERVIVIEGVAAERVGTFNLVRNPGHPGDHKLGENGDAVPGWTLDSLIESYDVPSVSLIKIDVQGAELRVVQGAQALLRRDQPGLLIEIDPAALAAMGASTQALIDALSALGYRGVLGHDPAASPVVTAASVEASLADRGYADVMFVAAR